MNIKLSGNAGFTLVELIVVIAILGILSTVAVPQYTAYIDRAQSQVENASAIEQERESMIAAIATYVGIE